MEKMQQKNTMRQHNTVSQKYKNTEEQNETTQY